MKILQICSARTIGGGERHVTDLSRHLSERGHEVFAAIRTGSAIRDEFSFLPDKRVAEFELRGPMDLFSAMAIAKFVRENEIDLIHAHVARDYIIAANASSMSGVPFGITRHVLFPMSRFHRIFLRRSRFVIAPSAAVATSLRGQGIFPDNKIITIRHGLNAERYGLDWPGSEPLERHEIIIGSVGNLDPVKGFDILIRAARIVLNEIPNTYFEIVGEDREPDSRNERELKAMISKLGLHGRVRLQGWSGDIRFSLAPFDLFASASRSESFGYAIAEAMLSGIPVVATETEGAKEIIPDPSVGILVPIDSPDELAAAIIDLIGDPAKRDQLAEAGRRHIRENFSIHRMIEETESLYNSVISTGK